MTKEKQPPQASSGRMTKERFEKMKEIRNELLNFRNHARRNFYGFGVAFAAVHNPMPNRINLAVRGNKPFFH